MQDRYVDVLWAHQGGEKVSSMYLCEALNELHKEAFNGLVNRATTGEADAIRLLQELVPEFSLKGTLT